MPGQPKVIAHVSPYRRIEISGRAAQRCATETEGAIAKAIREATEDKQRIEHLRIWNHVVQTAQGCNPAREQGE